MIFFEMIVLKYKLNVKYLERIFSHLRENWKFVENYGGRLDESI